MSTIQTTLTDDELSEICNKVIKYLVVKNLYESFIDTCKQEGYKLEEIK